jgi:glucose/arabinose dehydrogenase
VHLDAQGNVISQEQLLNDKHWRIRDVRVSPDGYLYVSTDEADGRVLRLEPAASS